MRILLDTNAYSDLKRGHPPVAALVRRSARVYLSAVVVGELMYGFRNGGRLDQNLPDLEAFLASAYVSFVAVTLETADRFGRVAAQLRKKGTPIPSNDIWIAAAAMETGATLVSADDHFASVDGLAWIQPESGSS